MKMKMMRRRKNQQNLHPKSKRIFVLRNDENTNFNELFRRHAKMSNGNSSTPTTDEFLSIVKKKFDRRKDRVKTLSVDDFE